MKLLKEIETENIRALVAILALVVFTSLSFVFSKALSSGIDRFITSIDELGRSVKRIDLSISELNNKMSIVLTRQDGLKTKVKDHEERLRDIERKEHKHGI